jgi:hypothetical protein
MRPFSVSMQPLREPFTAPATMIPADPKLPATAGDAGFAPS